MKLITSSVVFLLIIQKGLSQTIEVSNYTELESISSCPGKPGEFVEGDTIVFNMTLLNDLTTAAYADDHILVEIKPRNTTPSLWAMYLVCRGPASCPSSDRIGCYCEAELGQSFHYKIRFTAAVQVNEYILRAVWYHTSSFHHSPVIDLPKINAQTYPFVTVEGGQSHFLYEDKVNEVISSSASLTYSVFGLSAPYIMSIRRNDNPTVESAWSPSVSVSTMLTQPTENFTLSFIVTSTSAVCHHNASYQLIIRNASDHLATDHLATTDARSSSPDPSNLGTVVSILIVTSWLVT